MGRNVGIEPTHNGTTIRRVNHFTNCAISINIIAKYNNKFKYKIKILKRKRAKKNWQLAIFAYTIFAVKVLNFSVRYGKRCIHFAIVTN